jgi:hypothetical protein
MRNTIRVLWTGIAIAQLAALGAQAASTYQLDTGSVKYYLNASDGTEPRDNWFANEFTAVASGTMLTQVVYGVFTTAPSSVGDVVIYRMGALGATRLYTQAFTPLTGNGTNTYLQSINLTTPVQLTAGEQFLVAIFEPNVAANMSPYLLDTSTSGTGSFWDRSTPNTFNLDNLSGAVPVDQMLADSNWAPGPYHLIIRVNGTVVPEPSVCALGGLAVFVVAMLRRRAK